MSTRLLPHVVLYPLAIALAAGAGFVGRGVLDEQDDATVQRAPTAVASTPTPSPTVAPTATASAAGGLGVRQTEAGSLTVYAVRDRVQLDSEPDEPGTHWAAIDAEFCYKNVLKDDAGKDADAVPVSWDFWSLNDAANRRYRAFTSGSTPAFLTPSYPQSEPVSLGECVRGWIMVPVEDGAKVTTVRYKNSVEPAATWKVTPKRG